MGPHLDAGGIQHSKGTPRATPHLRNGLNRPIQRQETEAGCQGLTVMGCSAARHGEGRSATGPCALEDEGDASACW